MGHHNYQQNHQAVDNLVNLLTKANHDLTMVQYKLEKEFQQIYPDNANPMKLFSRIKKVQEDLPILKEQCRELLAAKQDLIDKARTVLVGNRSLVQRMQAPLDIPVISESEDHGFANFKQVIDEWIVQVRSRTGDEEHDSDSEDINKLLFSTIVNSN
ncbi:spindle and kinetochore-associated protein 2 [Melia azedarach]|uniref:Spindle and kinetochore-associated protein 2 n=1 Tax=Melia azedarach TaxID=155640 RepID=A0ACC1X992_MELAZ|nr:spindle and kinetochore-associated protein 2 [Melia azedarach]